MNSLIQNIKGIHPGIFLDRELKKRGLAKGPFALSIGEYPQTLSAITHGKRGVNPSLAIRIEEALGMEEGTLMILQVFYDIKLEKAKMHSKQTPDMSKLRPALFWDTDISKIDWIKNQRFVMERVEERGDELEKAEIKRFYDSRLLTKSDRS
jgi:plasmid maintenance system antidote protein VapI